MRSYKLYTEKELLERPVIYKGYVPEERFSKAAKENLVVKSVTRTLESFISSAQERLLASRKPYTIKFNNRKENSCDKDSNIRLSTLPARKNFLDWHDDILGIAFHEFCHYWITPFKMLFDFIENCSNTPNITYCSHEITKAIVNILEDVRIERAFKEVFPEEFEYVKIQRSITANTEYKKILESNAFSSSEKENLVSTHVNLLLVFMFVDIPKKVVYENFSSKYIETFEFYSEIFGDTFTDNIYDMIEAAEAISIYLSKFTQDNVENIYVAILDLNNQQENQQLVPRHIEEDTDDSPIDSSQGVDYYLTDVTSRINPNTLKNDFYKTLRGKNGIINAVRNAVTLRTKKVTFSDKSQKYGKLDTNKFVSYASGSKNIYLNTAEESTADFFIGVLVDLSGSMRGKDIIIAKEVSSILSEALFNNPFCDLLIYGHTSGSKYPVVEEERYNIDFDKAENGCAIVDFSKSKYATECIRAFANNLDGYAIRKVSDIIRKRSGNKKGILLVISDGNPSGKIRNTYYTGDKALKHTKESVIYSRTKNNIPCIQIAIGNSIQSHKMFENWVTLKSSDKLPKAMYDIIKKQAKNLV